MLSRPRTGGVQDRQPAQISHYAGACTGTRACSTFSVHSVPLTAFRGRAPFSTRRTDASVPGTDVRLANKSITFVCLLACLPTRLFVCVCLLVFAFVCRLFASAGHPGHCLQTPPVCKRLFASFVCEYVTQKAINPQKEAIDCLIVFVCLQRPSMTATPTDTQKLNVHQRARALRERRHQTWRLHGLSRNRDPCNPSPPMQARGVNVAASRGNVA